MADGKAKFLDVKSGAGNTLVFALGNGTRVVFDPARASDEIRQQAMYHGFNQKIRDAAAGYSKEKDFAGAAKEMQAVVDALYDGAWKRQGGGAGAGVVMEDLATALAELKGVDFAKAMAAVSAANEDQRKAWSKNAKVAAAMARAKAARLERAAGGDESELDIDFGEEDETEADDGEDDGNS